MNEGVAALVAENISAATTARIFIVLYKDVNDAKQRSLHNVSDVYIMRLATSSSSAAAAAEYNAVPDSFPFMTWLSSLQG